MAVGHRPRLLEDLEGPINGGLVDFGVTARPCGLEDPRRGQVAPVTVGDHLADRTAGQRDPEAIVSERIDEDIGGHVHAPRICR